MNRRRMLVALLLAAPLLAGCDKLSFMPQARKKKVSAYESIQNGMSEADVKRVMGEPTQRQGYNLEGGTERAMSMTYVGGGNLITITFVRGQVVGKQKY
jgi:hypothetical protein